MPKHKLISIILTLTLLLAPWAGVARASAPPQAVAAPQAGLSLDDRAEVALPAALQAAPGAGDWWSAVQADIRQSEYRLTGWGGDYQALNRAQNFRTCFTPQGVRLTPRSFTGATPPWEWSLALTGYGYAGAVQPVARASLSAQANRIEYRRGSLTEWYLNDERGLEQGFTLHTPPSPLQGKGQGAEVILDLTLTGSLTPRLSGDGQMVEFTTLDGVHVLDYSSLLVTDAAGRSLPARFSLLSGKTLRISLDARRAVYPVTVDPLATTPAWSIVGVSMDALGYSVGTAGDVNGDSYDDFIVGVRNYNGAYGGDGRAMVFYGSASGLSTTPDWSVIGSTGSAALGWSVGTAGDVNGDGYDDVIVGAPGSDGYYGRASVYHGGAAGLSTSPAWSVTGAQAGMQLGSAVGTAGDVNGDGYVDVIVGAYQYTNGQDAEGIAYVYHGGAGGLSATPNWTAQEVNVEYAWFGYSAGTAGDVNGDGYSDVIIGAPSYPGSSYAGQVFVYHGSASGLAATPARTYTGAAADSRFGASVGTAGNVNGDGYSDAIIGSPRYTNGQSVEGRATVYYGSASGLPASPSWMMESNLTFAYLGIAVGSAGDVNADGYGDVIIGLGGYTDGEEHEGQARIYYGASGGLPATAGWATEGNVATACYGGSVGAAGDVNYDGYSDVIVGAPANGECWLWGEAGRAYLYLGAPDVNNQPPVANAGADQTVNRLATVALDGSASSDPDGDLPLAYLWTQTGGPAVTLSDPSAAGPTFTAPGDLVVFTFTLVVTDSLGLADLTPDVVVVTVANQAPVADAGLDQTVNRLATVSLDGSGSDPDGDLPLAYRWTQTGGPAVTLSDATAASLTFTAPGNPATLTFSLVVTDSLGLADPTPDQVTITVNNQPPVANAGADQSVNTLATVTLDGSGSDPDGDLPLAYRWTQTGGPAVTLSDSTAASPTFIAPGDPATLTFSLVVSDSLGKPDPTPDQVTITVNNQAPVAHAGLDQTVNRLATVTLDGSASSDPDGDLPLAYLWTQTGGPAVTLSDATVAGPTFTAPGDLTVLTFTLVVTDSLGLADPTPDPIVVTVDYNYVYLPLVSKH